MNFAWEGGVVLLMPANIWKEMDVKFASMGDGLLSIKGLPAA